MFIKLWFVDKLHPLNLWSKCNGKCKPVFIYYEKYLWNKALRKILRNKRKE